MSRKKGNAKLAPTSLIVAMLIALATVPAVIAFAKYFYRYPVYELHNVLIEGNPKHNEYQMRYISESAGVLHFYTRFCSDLQVTFPVGSSFKLLRYEDRGMCWSVAPDYAGYIMEADKDGKLIIRSPDPRPTTGQAPKGAS